MSLQRLPWLVFALLVAAGFWWVGRSGSSAPANDHVVLTWFSVITPLRDHYEAQAAAFMRDIEVRILWVPNSEYNVKLKTLAAAGQLPDLFLSGDVWISYLLPLTMDITPFVERDAAQFGLQDFFPQIQAAMKHEGRYYIMPEYMNLSLLYYNRKMFSDAGLSEPTDNWNWDDLVAAGKRLTHAGAAGQELVQRRFVDGAAAGGVKG